MTLLYNDGSEGKEEKYYVTCSVKVSVISLFMRKVNILKKLLIPGNEILYVNLEFSI